MLGSCDIVAFVSTSDPESAQRFYRDVLGLTQLSESPYALEFATGADGAGRLRVTIVEELVVAPYTVLGWAVADIDAAVSELGERGVVFERYPGMDQDVRGVWTSPSGARVAWFTDPGGNTLSVAQG